MAWPDEVQYAKDSNGNVVGLMSGSSTIGLPSRFGKTVALLGDSIAQNNNWDGAAFTTKFNSLLGFFSHTSVMTGKRFITTPSLNFGVFGDTTTGILYRVDSVISANPDIVVLIAGTNDIGSDVPSATIIMNIQSICAKLTANGITVILGTIIPRSDATMTANRSKVLQQVNQQIRSLSATIKNVYICDWYNDLADTTSTVSAQATNMLVSDNIHPSRQGAYWMGKRLATLLTAIYPQPAQSRYPVLTGSDIYDATYAPNGNLLTNSMLTGTGGTKTGAIATGNFADNWTITRTLGSTLACVGSKGTTTLVNGQTYATQILTLSSAGSGIAFEEFSFYQNFTTVPGDNIVGGAIIDVSSLSGTKLLNYVTPRVQAQYGSYSIIGRDAYYGGAAYGIPENYSGYTETNISISMPTGGTSCQLGFDISLDCTAASAVGVVITISLPVARKI